MSLRHFGTMTVLVALSTMGGVATPARGAGAIGMEEAVVRFQDPVLVGGRFLMGKVLFVHDEERKARGEPCTLIYRLDGRKAPERVVAFHCKRVNRAVADQFTLGMRTTDLGFRVLTAYQFSGSDHAHQVLTPNEAARLHAAH